MTRSRVRPHWFDGDNRFWYRNDLAGSTHEFVLVDAEKGARQPAFDHKRLAAALDKANGTKTDPQRLPFRSIRFSGSASKQHCRAAGTRWICDLKTYALGADKTPEKPADAKKPLRRKRRPRGRRLPERNSPHSPKGKWTALIRNDNVVIRDNDTQKERTLTRDGTPADGYIRRFYWSPDATKLVAMRRKKGGDRKVRLIESSPKKQLQPILHEFRYLKPGDRIPQTKPHLFDIRTRREIPLDDALFSNPWRISEVRWSPDSGRFTFLYNQRGHQVLRVVGVDAGGKTRAVIDETSKTFIDYRYKKFTHDLDDTGEIIWMSERDGWNHLYLYDAKTGKVKNQITKGHWVVRGVERVDEKRRQIWFRASGVYPKQDPYYIHYCRVNFDGNNLVLLTEGDGTHSIRYSPDRRFFIDTFSRVDSPPVTELRRSSDGKFLCQLERADWSALLKTGWNIPERFSAKGRDGKTDIYGVIFRPKTFDVKRKYPVIEKIYAGPHGSFVPKAFRSYHSAQAMAELGFIVVQIDGMGTSNRSKAFHDVCWKNLADSGFPDRIAWIKAAAAKYPYMDLTRVGIYGGSAGGQSALRALLAHGGFYKAAAADCGCHDNRMDKIWWNELWMGWPVGPHYKQQSNVTNAHKLQGKLLLTVGELDRNVDPASTMQVVDALIKADKDFELLVVPGGGHGVGETRYGKRRRRDFFVRHLLKVEPRSKP
ncbi:MAG: prolyl oligopeptidase family serine peptidase [Planctomycetaceae bacterium]